MPDVLGIIAPIFLLIALGWGAVRWALYPAEGLPALGAFIVRFALPALLFNSVARRSVAEVLNPRYLAAYAAGSLVAFGAGVAWARWARGRPLDAAAMAGMGMSCANSAFIGLPVVLQVVGPEAAVALALTMMVENFLMIPLCLALADSASHRHDPFWKAMLRAIAGLRRSPIVLAIFVGFAFALLPLRLPAPVGRAVDLLAGASAAAALFYVGGTLAGLRVGALLGQSVVIALGKLVLHPLAVLVALLLAGPIAPPLQASAVLLACAPMLGIYPLLGQKYGHQGENAAAMLVCTAAAFFTMGAVIWGLQASAIFGPLH